MRIVLLCLILISLSCNENVETVTYDNKSDTTLRSIDNSEMINDSTRLPRDSTRTGVQH